jgi:hypothetical protein
MNLPSWNDNPTKQTVLDFVANTNSLVYILPPPTASLLSTTSRKPLINIKGIFPSSGIFPSQNQACQVLS